MPLQNPQHEDALQPPMGRLLALLRESGFPATTDDYVDLLRIVALYGDEGLDSLARRICPIIATTPEEQDRFYNVFERYRQEQAPTPGPEDSGPTEKERPFWLVPLLILLMMLAVWAWQQWPGAAPVGWPAVASGPGDTPVLSRGADWTQDILERGVLGTRRAGDSAHVTAVWEDLGHGRLGEGRRIRHRFIDTGLHRVVTTLSSPKLPIGTATDTQSVYVCDEVPQIRIIPPGDMLPAGRELRFRAAADSSRVRISGYSWQTDGQGQPTLMHPDSPYRALFGQPGAWRISCTPVIPGAPPRCLRPAVLDLNVVDTGVNYVLEYLDGNQPAKVRAPLKLWPGALALLLAAATLLLLYRKRRKKPGPPAADTDPEAPPPAPKARPGAPYEVPFTPVAADGLRIDPGLRRFLQQLKQRAGEGIQVLDVQASIRATIRQAGLAQAVLAPQRSVERYLVFIDKTAPRGLLFGLYNQLADVMERDGVPVTRFYYDAAFRCFNSEFPAGISLERVADQHAQHDIPLIFGDGKALLHRVAPGIRPEILRGLQRWERCLLLTPVPEAAWREPVEGVLRKQLRLAAMDADSLERFGQQLRSGSSLRYRPGLNTATRPVPDTAFHKPAFLRDYLGDEILFQWLCALAIYPKLRWELLIALGGAVLRENNRDGELRFDVILRMCRIPWMANGTMSQGLRADLLDELRDGNEVAARAALHDLLRDVDLRYPGAHYFSAEKDLQDLLSRFVLYAHDPERFPQHAGAVPELATRLANGSVTDVPARKYLESAPVTPLRHGGVQVGLREYLGAEAAARSARQEAEAQARTKAGREAVTRRRARKAMTAFCVLGLLFSVWFTLRFNEGGSRVPQLQSLYAFDSAQLIPVRIRVSRDFSACNDRDSVFAALPGTLTVGGTAQPLRFNAATQTLEADVPFRILHPGVATSLMLGMHGGKVARLTPESLTTGGVLRVTCARFDAIDTVSRGFTAARLPVAYDEIWAVPELGLGAFALDIRVREGRIYENLGGGHDPYGRSDAATYRMLEVDTVIRDATGYLVIAAHQSGFVAYFLEAAPDGPGFRMQQGLMTYPTAHDALAAGRSDMSESMQMRPWYAPEQEERILLPRRSAGNGEVALDASQVDKAQLLAKRMMAKVRGGTTEAGYYLHTGFGDKASYELGNHVPLPFKLTYYGVVPFQIRPFGREFISLSFKDDPGGIRNKTNTNNNSNKSPTQSLPHI